MDTQLLFVDKLSTFMLTSFWQQFLTRLGDTKESSPIVYSLIRQLVPEALSEDKLTLKSDNPGFVYFLKKKIPFIEKQLKDFAGKKMAIEIIVVPKKKRVEPPLLRFEPTVEDIYRKAGLSSKYSFENFAVSNTNQVAFAAASAVSQELGKSYNPLFLWGSVGVGKTHLAQAIARRVLDEKQGSVLFCPGDQFTNELIEAIRERSTAKFRRKYRHLDVFVVDDVQFIGGKNHVQEEFFHTFNTIVSRGGQVILTADRPPYEIRGLEDRLRSRFSGGLIADIQPPDYELRTAILLIKAREKNIPVDIEIAKIIAEQVSDARSIEGTLLSLYAKTLGGKEMIDLEVVEMFFDNKKKSFVAQIGPNDVIKSVCDYYNIKQSHLKSSIRATEFALPRQLTMFLLRKKLGLKYDNIARILKRKDHTTIMHGVSKIGRLLAKDSVFKQDFDRLTNTLVS